MIFSYISQIVSLFFNNLFSVVSLHSRSFHWNSIPIWKGWWSWQKQKEKIKWSLVLWLPDKVLNSWQRQYFKRKSNFQTLSIRKFWAWKTTQDQRESWRVECWHVTRRMLQTIGTVLVPQEGMGRSDPPCRSGDLKAEGIRALIFRSSLRSHKLHGGPIWVQRQESWNSYMLCPHG